MTPRGVLGELPRACSAAATLRIAFGVKGLRLGGETGRGECGVPVYFGADGSAGARGSESGRLLLTFFSCRD